MAKHDSAQPPEITQGSATNLAHLADESISAVVVDPPYADNVQYSELADFFYVWLKRTQGHRRPEWFSTYLCDHDEEAVVNVSRHRSEGEAAKSAKAKANAFYQDLMTRAFREAHQVLRREGALTVMFTHKKQEAWEALFSSLIRPMAAEISEPELMITFGMARLLFSRLSAIWMAKSSARRRPSIRTRSGLAS